MKYDPILGQITKWFLCGHVTYQMEDNFTTNSNLWKNIVLNVIWPQNDQNEVYNKLPVSLERPGYKTSFSHEKG